MQRVGTVDKCFDIIEAALASGDEGLGIREISRRLEINPTTVHNLCWTLCARGYMRQDPNTKRFKLGAGFLPLAQSSQVWRSLAESVDSLIRRCHEELDESILLAVMDHTEISTLIYLPSTQALRVHEPRALGANAYGTAVGKLLLSSLKDEDLDEYIEQFPPRPFQDGENIEPDDIRKEMKAVQLQGYAVSCDEVAIGISAVAIPISGPSGETIAALGASAPTVRMDKSKTKLTRNTLIRYGELVARTWFRNWQEK